MAEDHQYYNAIMILLGVMYYKGLILQCSFFSVNLYVFMLKLKSYFSC